MKNVIIIGSGIGGLVAGNLLAQRGHQVTIFEAHSLPGGYTAGFYRQGYYFESGTVAFEASSSIFKAMQDIGVLGKINFVQHGMRFVSGDFDVTPKDYHDFKKSVYDAFPTAKEKLDMIFSDLDEIVSPLGAMNKPIPYLYSGPKMLVSMLPYILSGPKLMKVTKKYGNLTSSEFTAQYFAKDSKLYKLFSGFGYPDMSAVMVGSGLWGLFTELWTVKDGMQSWADILAENFRKLGGNLKLKSYVDRIITQNGAAVGVSCQDTVYPADYVISAGDYKKTLLKLLDDPSLIPPPLRDNIVRAAVSEGYFTVYLGLNMPGEELGRYMKVPHVLVFSKPGCDIYNSQDREFFSKSSAEVYSPSMVNPQLAPVGKSSLMLQTKAPYRWLNNWGDGDRKTYGQLKKKAMDALIENMSQLIPGLQDYIDYQDAATPLTYERFTQNTDGASTAWSPNPKQAFYKNTLSVNIETPVKNLYIGSSWAMTMGGVPGAVCAAYQCAKKISKG
jgi:phytoene dehydrogenase-like protein